MNELLSLPPLAWLANYLLHSTVLFGAVWLLDVFGILRGARQREFAWRLAFAGALITASVHFIAPAISISGEPQLVLDRVAAPEAASLIVMDTPADTMDTAAPPPPVAVMPATGKTGVSIQAKPPTAPLLLGLWMFGAMFLLARLAWTARLAARELSSRLRIVQGPLHERLRTLCASTGSVPPLSVVEDLPGPLTLPNGEICVPRWADEQLQPSQLDAMLAHELAHVRRRDPLLLLLITVLEALLFVQPLNRIAHRRLAALAEMNADADAARMTGNTRALAETLAECIQRIQAHPAQQSSLVGVPMARRRSPVIHRVERLLGGIVIHEKQISGALRSFGFAALLGAILLLPAFGARDAEARHGVLFGTSVVENDEVMTFEIGRPGYFLRVHAKGDVQFTADDRGIAKIEEDGHLRIREKRDGVVHELVVTNDGDDLQYEYSLDGDSTPFDTQARDWLTKVIPEILRNTGLDAEGRIARLHARGGVEAVLDELKLIDSGHALAIYAGILVNEHTLDDKAIQQLLLILREVDSDFELRQALTNVISGRKLSEDTQRQVLLAAAGIESDFEAAELLQLITPQLKTSDRILSAWRRVIDDIDSDFEQRRTLSAVFERDQLGRAWKVAALQAGTEGIGSDFELRSLLESAAPHVNGDQQLTHLYIEALNEIGSDFDARQAVVALVEDGKLNEENYFELLDALEKIGSDFETGEALDAIAKNMPRNSALIEKYRAVARTLSSHERQQAEDALD